MSGRRWSKSAAAFAAGMLSVALVACGPADSGTGGLQSVGTSAPAVATGSSAVMLSAAQPVAATSSIALGVTGMTVLAQLTTSTGVAATGTVTFSVDGSPIGTAPLAGDQATIVIPPGQLVGDHTVTAQFSSDNTALVTNAAGTAGFSAARAGSSIAATVGKDSIRYGDQASFEIVVQAPVAPAGTDLTGHVTVLDGDVVVAEGDTDAAGSTSLGVYNTADPGSKTYRVSYSGGPLVDPSTTQFTVQTTQTDVDIAITWTRGLLPGADATITADVIGTPKSPTGAATISYDGKQINSGPVDGNGKISGSAKAVTVGDHQIQVSYAGDVRFEPKTASSTLQVKEPVANPNQAGAAAVQASNPCPAAASACVNLSKAQAWLQTGGQITYGPVPITSGRSGYRTGTGMFSVFWRDKNHKSSLFNDAPMPNSVFFNGGTAFHQGSLSDQSHGCIHLSGAAAATFFDTLSVGDAVYVWGAAPY